MSFVFAIASSSLVGDPDVRILNLESCILKAIILLSHHEFSVALRGVSCPFCQISRFESWLAENPEALNEIGGGVDINGGDLGLLEQWKASKKKITMPEEGGVMDQLK